MTLSGKNRFGQHTVLRTATVQASLSLHADAATCSLAMMVRMLSSSASSAAPVSVQRDVESGLLKPSCTQLSFSCRPPYIPLCLSVSRPHLFLSPSTPSTPSFRLSLTLLSCSPSQLSIDCFPPSHIFLCSSALSLSLSATVGRGSSSSEVGEVGTLSHCPRGTPGIHTDHFGD